MAPLRDFLLRVAACSCQSTQPSPSSTFLRSRLPSPRFTAQLTHATAWGSSCPTYYFALSMLVKKFYLNPPLTHLSGPTDKARMAVAAGPEPAAEHDTVVQTGVATRCAEDVGSRDRYRSSPELLDRRHGHAVRSLTPKAQRILRRRQEQVGARPSERCAQAKGAPGSSGRQ